MNLCKEQNVSSAGFDSFFIFSPNILCACTLSSQDAYVWKGISRPKLETFDVEMNVIVGSKTPMCDHFGVKANLSYYTPVF